MPLTKTGIKRAFTAASSTYDSAAGLQRKVGLELLKTIDAKLLSGTLLDIGCGTGFLTAEILERFNHDSITALDIAWTMLKTTQQKLALYNQVHYVCADAEQLPFGEQCLDGVFSNLALQWCSDLDGVFSSIRRALKPGKPLVFSTFGPQTLSELKSAWASVDSYQHVNSFYSEAELRQFLVTAGFKNIQLLSVCYSSSYSSVLALMQELKQLGAHHVVKGANKQITTKTAMQQMISAYQKQGENDQILATFEVISITATA